jgi:sugar fermentation stimulation protein A
VDTALPNKVVKAALEAQQIAGLEDYSGVKPEVKYGQNSRVDFLLTGADLPDCYVEVKSVTLMRRAGLAEFPDSVTKRGTKHLEELARMVAAGHRAVMLYLVQHTACTGFALARDIDPAYGAAFDAARTAGVGVLCIGTTISPAGISPGAPVKPGW